MVTELTWAAGNRRTNTLVYRGVMNRSLTEMAIRGLEVERQRIDDAIRELRSQIEDGQDRQHKQTEPHSQTMSTPAKRGMSAAGRKRIGEANRRRAEAARQAAPAPAGKKAVKRGGLTPEGRARLAEAVRQRNIARAAANKKAAPK